MFTWLKRLGPDARGLAEITQLFGQMLEDGRHIFDAASNALLGGTDPETIRRDLFDTDARINSTEQRMRREIVVHGSIHGSATFPAMLTLMSLGKDAERIGDYAKNVFDLAVRKTRLGGETERKELTELKDQISRLLVRARHLFENQDVELAKEFLREADVLQDRCDAGVDRVIEASGENMASAVLAYRYFKRVTSHVANIVTSVIVPLDKLDFFDEPKAS